jgi:hypothetical protein
MSKYQFKCRSSEGHTLKLLFDLLVNNLRTANFLVSPHGITMSMCDTPRRVMFDIDLEADRFVVYKNTNAFAFGINTGQLSRVMKTVKKKDSVKFSIARAEPQFLNVCVIPRDQARTTISRIRIHPIQHESTPQPTGYTLQPISVDATDIQKACKDLMAIGSTNVRVTRASRTFVDLATDDDGIITRSIRLGGCDSDSDDDDDDDDDDYDYDETFDMIIFSRIQKISSVGCTVHIHAQPGKPLHIRTSIGNSGRLSIFIKSNAMMTADN